MPASFLASLLLLAATPNLAPLPGATTDSSPIPQLALLPPAEATLTAATVPSSPHRLAADVIVLDPGSQLTAVRQQVATLPASEDSLQEFFAGDRWLLAAAGARTGVGVGALEHDTASFGFSAQWQATKQAKLQIRLGEDRPFRLDLVETPSRTETAVSWQALPTLSLTGKSRGDGGATFGGKVTFGEGRRHSFSLLREDPATATGTTEALLALGGSVATKINYRFRDRGSDRWQISQDLGALRWEVRKQSGRLRISTSLALKRDANGSRRASFDIEHSTQSRDLDTRTLTAVTLNSRLWGWQGALGVAWNQEGQAGAVVSAQLPLLGPTLNLKGSYRGLAINGRRQDYRLELRSRFQF